MQAWVAASAGIVGPLSLLRAPTASHSASKSPIYGHRVEFCDRVSATRGVAVHKLTKSTRDGVTAERRESLVARFVKPKPSGKRKRK